MTNFFQIQNIYYKDCIDQKYSYGLNINQNSCEIFAKNKNKTFYKNKFSDSKPLFLEKYFQKLLSYSSHKVFYKYNVYLFYEKKPRKHKYSPYDIFRIDKFYPLIQTFSNEKNDVFSKDSLNEIKKKILEILKISSSDSDAKNNTRKFLWEFLQESINSEETKNLLIEFQDSFNKLLDTQNLSKNFDFPTAFSPAFIFYTFNETSIYNVSNKEILKTFKKSFPDLKDRQLISSYINFKILDPVRKSIIRNFPGITNFSPVNSHIHYFVKKLSNGSILLKVVYLSDLIKLDNVSNKRYTKFGMKATCILFKDKLPSVKYYFFVK